MQHSQLLRRCLLPASLHILRIARRRCLLPLVALLVLLFSSSALAQLIPDRQWVVFRQQDGLPSNDVYAVFADGATIWFGTAAGISSYDGRWHAYSTAVSGGHDPVEPIPLGKVVDFATSNTEGAIWAATDSGLVIRWDGQRWTKYTQINTRVHALAEVAGTLWVATERGMLIIASDNVVRAVPLLGNAAVYDLAVVDDGVWLGSERGLWWLSADGEHGRHAVVVNESGAVIDGVVRSVWEAEPGRLWLGMGGMIVDYMPDAGTAQIYQPFMSELSGLSVTAITGIPNDSIWVGASNGGAVQFMLSGRDIVSARNWGSAAQGGLTTNNVRDVVVDQDGSVWFATSVGVFRYQPWAWLGIEDRLDAPPVNDVLLDRIGGLWIATAGEGVQYRAELHSRPILYYPEPAGLPSEFVNALAEDATGQIWAATREGLARFSDRQWQSLAMESALLAEPMRDIEVDDLGLWVGTAKGVLRYDFADGRVAVEPITDGRAIIALAYDSTGRLWVAAANGELWLRAVTGSWYDLTASEGRPGNAPVTALYPDLRQPGHMLLALQGYGVYRSDGEAFEFVENSYRLAGDRIFALLLDGKDGSIWVGSETGLSRLDNISWSTFDAQERRGAYDPGRSRWELLVWRRKRHLPLQP
ncbi:MAG: hypothetical protein H3C34_03015 [Caldilineaceae bacterium]|nr:hypothetical protein [Caldilineaceae bacterium]